MRSWVLPGNSYIALQIQVRSWALALQIQVRSWALALQRVVI